MASRSTVDEGHPSGRKVVLLPYLWVRRTSFPRRRLNRVLAMLPQRADDRRKEALHCFLAIYGNSGSNQRRGRGSRSCVTTVLCRHGLGRQRQCSLPAPLCSYRLYGEITSRVARGEPQLLERAVVRAARGWRIGRPLPHVAQRGHGLRLIKACGAGERRHRRLDAPVSASRLYAVTPIGPELVSFSSLRETWVQPRF